MNASRSHHRYPRMNLHFTDAEMAWECGRMWFYDMTTSIGAFCFKTNASVMNPISSTLS